MRNLSRWHGVKKTESLEEPVSPIDGFIDGLLKSRETFAEAQCTKFIATVVHSAVSLL